MVNHGTGHRFVQFLSLYSSKTFNGPNGVIKGRETGPKKETQGGKIDVFNNFYQNMKPFAKNLL